MQPKFDFVIKFLLYGSYHFIAFYYKLINRILDLEDQIDKISIRSNCRPWNQEDQMIKIQQIKCI